VPSYSVTVRHVPAISHHTTNYAAAKVGLGWGEKGVAGRGAPLILIESPRWTSSRMGPTSAIVALKPLPPDSEVSIGVNSETVPRCSTFGQSVGDGKGGGGRGVPIPVNMMGGGDGDDSLEIEMA